jgi:hypothetical protein
MGALEDALRETEVLREVCLKVQQEVVPLNDL